MNKDDLIEMVKLCQCTNRFSEMAAIMKQIIQMGVLLSEEEREFLLIAYKSKVDANRNSIQNITMVQNSIKEFHQKVIIDRYKKTIVNELIDICFDLLTLIDDYLLPYTNDIEGQIFYLRIKGDFGRYLAEVAIGNQWDVAVEIAEESYKAALHLSSNHLLPVHPIHLSLIVNYSIFLYDILGQRIYSYEYSNNALDNAIKCLPGNLNAIQLKISMKLMAIIYDNIQYWKMKALETIHNQINLYLNDDSGNEDSYSVDTNYDSNIDSGYDSSHYRTLSSSSTDSLLIYSLL